jgi:serine/threonine protein kinase
MSPAIFICHPTPLDPISQTMIQYLDRLAVTCGLADMSEEATPSNPGERWAMMRDHLDRALAMPDSERAAYLDRACAGDSSLRSELESLIRAAQSDELATPNLVGAILPRIAFDEVSMIGKRISHYRIDARIGEGGMGAVYRVTDLNLGRTAALKLISRQIWAPDARSRFEREAKPPPP